MKTNRKRILRRFKNFNSLLAIFLSSGLLFFSCSTDDEHLNSNGFDLKPKNEKCDYYATGDILDDEVEPDEDQ